MFQSLNFPKVEKKRNFLIQQNSLKQSKEEIQINNFSLADKNQFNFDTQELCQANLTIRLDKDQIFNKKQYLNHKNQKGHINTDISKQKIKISNLNQQIQIVQEQISQYKKQLIEKQEEQDKYNQKNEKILKKQKDLIFSIQVFEVQLNFLNDQKEEDFQKQLKNVQNKIDDENNSNLILQQNIEYLQQEIKNGELTKKCNNEQILKLKQKQKQKQAFRKQIEQKNQGQLVFFKEHNDYLQNIQQSIQNKQQKNNALQSDLDGLKLNLNTQFQSIQISKDEQNQEIQNFQKQIDDQNKDIIQSKENQQKKNVDQKQEYVNKLQKLQLENNKLTNILTGFQNQYLNDSAFTIQSDLLEQTQKQIGAQIICNQCGQNLIKAITLIPCGHSFCKNCKQGYQSGCCKKCGPNAVIEKQYRNKLIDQLINIKDLIERSKLIFQNKFT